MSLRTRIAVTFLLLLTGVLVAVLSAVWIADHVNARAAVKQQLASNRQLLSQAAEAMAYDSGFRDAVADRDTATLATALENSGRRINASMAVLTTMEGDVIAASGSRATAGTRFPIGQLHQIGASGQEIPNILLDGEQLYQLVAVTVNSPLPVATVALGFDLGAGVVGLEQISGQEVSLIARIGDRWENVVTGDPVRAGPALDPHLRDAAVGTSGVQTGWELRDSALAKSLAAAQAPFTRLSMEMCVIAGVSLIVFAWAAFWIARNITQPLADLARSIDKIRDGSYDVPVSLQRRDELGVLAEGLQLMRTAVMNRDQSIRRLAYEDGLTGLMNRTAFSATLSRTLDEAAGAPIGVAIINLNRFRRINEHLGYSVGDAVLTKTAARLAAIPSVEAAVARLAADEFAACARLRDADDLRAWGTSLLVALSESVLVESQPIDISATLGLALGTGAGSTAADELLRRADLAVEQARREKRPLAIYDETRETGARDQLSLLGELRLALERDELRLFFQPKIELATGRVAGAEVLLRWQHPTRGLLGPGAFIPFAEQAGFIRRITRWTLDRAIAQGARWYAAGRPLILAVNISANDLADARLDARVAGLLSRHRLPPALLTLEVTESGFIEDPVSALGMLDSLAALNVTLSIDDFGTGYSSLSHLARMPANEVKIDRSFIQGLESDAEYAAVVRSAIDMGHSLGMKVVAEGIETEFAAQRLQAFGCDIGQGYLYAKPMPLDQLTTWLQGREVVSVIAEPIDFRVEEVTDTVIIATY